jgi:hypothetical protein
MSLRPRAGGFIRPTGARLVTNRLTQTKGDRTSVLVRAAPIDLGLVPEPAGGAVVAGNGLVTGRSTDWRSAIRHMGS